MEMRYCFNHFIHSRLDCSIRLVSQVCKIQVTNKVWKQKRAQVASMATLVISKPKPAAWDLPGEHEGAAKQPVKTWVETKYRLDIKRM